MPFRGSVKNPHFSTGSEQAFSRKAREKWGTRPCGEEVKIPTSRKEREKWGTRATFIKLSFRLIANSLELEAVFPKE